MDTTIVSELHKFRAKKKASTARLEIEGVMATKGPLSENSKKHLDVYEDILFTALEAIEEVELLTRRLKQQRIALSSLLPCPIS